MMKKVNKRTSSIQQKDVPHSRTARDSLQGNSNWNLPINIWMPGFVILISVNIHLLYRSYLLPGAVRSPVSHHHPNRTTIQNQSLSYYDWVPSVPAKINDPVDTSGFKDNVLKTVTPKILRLEDREIIPMELKPTKKVKKTNVRAFIIDDFFSQEECAKLRRVHDLHIKRMSAYDPIICFGDLNTLRFHLKSLGQKIKVDRDVFTQGTLCINSTFSSQLKKWGLTWSYGTGFYLYENQFSLEISRRIRNVIGFDEENGGAFRVVSYAQNVGYKVHTDCTRDGNRGTEDRYGTVLVYLSDVHIGGQTFFPELGISVKPKSGRALVFTSMSPEGLCDPTSIHAAQPVTKGHKYILQRWYYYQNFPGLEKRPPVPPIPVRKPTQAHVNCDQYKHGSCRWYDVWTYDVVLNY